MEYSIHLGDQKLVITKLEKADAPMGVVFGVIEFTNQNIGYDFIKEYCISMNYKLTDDYPEDKLISTMTIDSLSVKNKKGIEIKGTGNQISGMDSDLFEITLFGVPYPFYEKEFPHHVKAHNEILK